MWARAKGISMGSLSVVAVRVSSILLAWVIGSQVVRVKPATSACNLKCLTATNTSAIVAVVMTTVTNTVNILFWDRVKRGLCSLLDCCSSWCMRFSILSKTLLRSVGGSRGPLWSLANQISRIWGLEVSSFSASFGFFFLKVPKKPDWLQISFLTYVFLCLYRH